MELCEFSQATIYWVLCVGLPHCQQSSVPLLISCTENLSPSVHKTGYRNVYVLLLRLTLWSSLFRGVGGGIEIYTNGVWCEVFSVENCNVKNMQKYLKNNI
jgi:hypothetical protein